MKNSFIVSTILVSLLVFSNITKADEPNPFSIGVGAYAFSLASDSTASADYDFSGFNIAAAYAFNNHFQIRGTYFTLENDDLSAIESTGYDLMAYGGTGFSESGFRGYGGAGFYSDEWSFAGLDETYTGFQAGGGIGYNWGSVALDLVLTLRQAEEYEDIILASSYYSGSYVTTYIAMSGNLTVSYLF